MSKVFDVTYKYVYLNPNEKVIAKKMSPRGNYLQAFWHQTFLPVVMTSQYDNSSTLVSPSRDGDIVSIVCRGFTMAVCRGSSSRGGATALRQIIKLILNGRNAIITIDGPKGPIYKVKRGIFEMSRRTGTPILPIVNYPSHFWQFNSWDKFRVPIPFSTIYIKYGKPFIVGPDITKDDLIDYSITLENELVKLEQNIKEYIATT